MQLEPIRVPRLPGQAKEHKKIVFKLKLIYFIF